MISPSDPFDLKSGDSELLVVEAGKTELRYWRDLWSYRDLFYFLAWRDILVRYKQTTLGVAWALLQPFITLVVFTVVFGRLAKLPSEGAPYPILVFAALLPWQFFSRAFSEAGNSLINNSNLIAKIYFPRLIIPVSAIITALIDFLISCVFLALLLVWYRYEPDWRIMAVPFLTLLAFGAAMGAGLFSAALNVRYRDFRYIIPFVIQVGMFLSPVGFSSTIIPEKWRFLYSLNPLVGVIVGFRWAILRGEAQIYPAGFILSIVLVVIFLVGGISYFRATERRFADVI